MRNLLILLILTTPFSVLAKAQTLTVRLLNGKSAKPIGKKNISIHWDESFDATKVFIGTDGVGHTQIPQGAKRFEMQPGPRIGKEPSRVAFASCNDEKLPPIDIATVLDKGFVPRNVCGKKTVAARPGEVVFWGFPRPWWQPDFQ